MLLTRGFELEVNFMCVYDCYGSTGYGVSSQGYKIRVLYISFDKFLLAVEIRDLSQADKSIIRVSSFLN